MTAHLSVFRLAVASAVALAAVITGCDASSSGGGGSGASAPSCATPGFTKDQINLGVLFPNTGVAASQFADFRAGIDARFGEQNAEGGLNGRKLRYDWADDASGVPSNLSAAQTLVNADHDFALLEASATASGSSGYLQATNIPVLGMATDPSWNNKYNMVTWTNFIASGRPPGVWGKFVHAQGGTRAIVVSNSFVEASVAFAGGISTSLTDNGVAVVDKTEISTAADIVKAVATIQRDHIDVIAGVITSDVAAALIGATKNSSVPLKVAISPTLYDPAALASGLKGVAGAYSFVAIAPYELNLPAHRRYLAAMATYSPETRAADSFVGLNGWIGADLTIAGLKAAGPCPTRATFLAALRGMHTYSADGLVRPQTNLANYRTGTQCYTFVRIDPTGSKYSVQPTPEC